MSSPDLAPMLPEVAAVHKLFWATWVSYLAYVVGGFIWT